MILLGAGASVPFGIPAMYDFTLQFERGLNSDEKRFVEAIKESLQKSNSTIGFHLTYDLETLMAFLSDVSEERSSKPISVVTANHLVYNKLNIYDVKKRDRDLAKRILTSLKYLILKKCMYPIDFGIRERTFMFLDKFYRPLLSILNGAKLPDFNIRTRFYNVQRVFSTNWDVCFKYWVNQCTQFNLSDGTKLGKDGNPLFDLTDVSKRLENRPPEADRTFVHLPLHGSLDLIKSTMPKGYGQTTLIYKIPDIHSYYKSEENLKNMLIAYPFEAIGYNEAVKSPFLDLLYLLRETMQRENFLFIIGYSLRDPSVGSVIEEVLSNKCSNGKIFPLSSNIKERYKEANKSSFKTVIFTKDANKLYKKLEEMDYEMLSQTFFPVEIEFPRVLDTDSNIVNPKFETEYTSVLEKILAELKQIKLVPENTELSNFL